MIENIKIWTGKYWMEKKHIQKISDSLKKYYKTNSAWNKGLKYGKFDEPSSKRLRRNEEYYLKELEQNAKRSKDYYGLNLNRKKEIAKLRQEYQIKTGVGRKRRFWKKEEIEYLQKNYKHKSNLEMALELERSWSSIDHKLSRLKLITYHKYN